MEHTSRIVLHFSSFKIEILGLVISDAHLQRIILHIGPDRAAIRWPTN